MSASVTEAYISVQLRCSSCFITSAEQLTMLQRCQDPKQHNARPCTCASGLHQPATQGCSITQEVAILNNTELTTPPLATKLKLSTYLHLWAQRRATSEAPSARGAQCWHTCRAHDPKKTLVMLYLSRQLSHTRAGCQRSTRLLRWLFTRNELLNASSPRCTPY